MIGPHHILAVAMVMAAVYMAGLFSGTLGDIGGLLQAMVPVLPGAGQ